VLKAVEDVLARLGRRLARSRGSEVEERLRAWVAVYYGAQVDRLGFDARPEDNERTRMQRARILAIVGLFARATPVLEACTARCLRHLASNEALPPELADEIVRCAASVGDARLHERFIETSRRAVTPQTRRRMLFALAEFDAPGTLAASVAAALDPRLAPAGDRAGLWTALLARPQTATGTWRRLQRAWPRLEKQMPPILLTRLAAGTAAALPHAALAELRAFFEAHPLTAGARVLRQVAEEMAISKRFETRAGRDLEAYLAGSPDTP